MTCRWRGGCGQDAFDGDLCTYHAKVSGGLITTTRDGSSPDVVPILHGREAALAHERWTEYYGSLPPAPLVVKSHRPAPPRA